MTPTTPTAPADRRAHLAAIRRELDLRRRLLSATGDDVRAMLATLYRPCQELASLTPCDAAHAGGDDWRRVLKLYPRGRDGAAHIRPAATTVRGSYQASARLLAGALATGCIREAQVRASDSTAVLRAQLEVTQANQANLLTTVYWSLGLVAALAVLLVGYNWLVVQRNYERDKATIRNELRSEVAAELLSLREANQALGRELADAMAETAKKAIAADLNKLTSRISGVASRVLDLEIEQQETELKAATSAKQGSRALHAALKLLHIDVDREWEFNYAERLEQLDGILTWYKPPADEIATIDTALNRLPADYRLPVDGLRARLKALA